ncbi:two-component system sensor histidine kinase NtrB [Stenotrophomonas maltophilia]|uniref:two-component system sensor histidine kinase NtrB n=1 Tax=Stenotrophomonas maltophilia TaxID=40324 RepID=UPI0006ACA3D2|nr:PAS domain-containing sensor histidine kinase [Stenotrophomonas maltophilia]KOQ75265.1 transcriptional regulator [Stenotrophomonas maltophilia]
MDAAASTTSVLTDPSRQLRLLIDSVRDHALYLLDPEGIVCSWNPGAERIKGYSANEVVGTHFGRFYLPAERDAGEPQRLLRLAAQHGHVASEGWRVRHDGSSFRASVVIEPVIEGGELLGFVKITRDITEQWQAQRLLRDAQRALRNTQQFETVGRLSRGLSHEFNNLLTTIGNALDLLSLRVSGDDVRAAELLDAAQAATDRGALLTRQLLAFSTGQTLIREPLDMNALVRQWLPDLQRACPPTVTLDARLTPGLPPVSTDALQLQTALANLVANAVEATVDGGRILIGTALEHRLDPDADTTLQRGYVTLSVCDEGHGMAADIAERATEPFFTTKDIGKGSGLGLSQVFGFTTQSGGFVDVSTTPGVGTTVSLLLPATEETPDDR